MCGIFCCLYNSSSCQLQEICQENINRRGPDHTSSVDISLTGGWRITFAASVLQTQGNTLCNQPLCEAGNVLCWNGDVFRDSMTEERMGSDKSDTEILLERMSDTKSVCDTLKTIQGPYSIVYFEKDKSTLWFSRDAIGRYSLLWGFDEESHNFLITSVAHSSLPFVKEIPAIGIFEISLGVGDYGILSMKLHPWYDLRENDIANMKDQLPVSLVIRPALLQCPIFKPLRNLPVEPSPEEFKKMNQFLSNKSSFIFDEFLCDDSVNRNVCELLTLLERSVKVRVMTKSKYCKICTVEFLQNSLLPHACSHSKISISFSGGLDSAILAALTHRFIPENESIDLLNVAFEKPTKPNLNEKSRIKKQKHEKSNVTEEDIFNVPDRLTGRQTLEELKALYPQRRWNFVEIDVPQSELDEKRINHISHLIHPLDTILDDSIGCALWFACRGQGRLKETGEQYTCPARIILLGMGADEQFGGYMRHRTALKHRGWKALSEELQQDLERIPSRNLGRDNRVASDHGRQPRLPYLDESVISFTKELAPWEKCCPIEALPSGTGDKFILRLVAWKLGLKGAAIFPKRAMQFGSRIANSKENAADKSFRLLRITGEA